MRTIALFLPGALDVASSRGKEAIIALAAVLHLAARLSPSPSASGVDAACHLKSSRYMPLRSCWPSSVVVSRRQDDLKIVSIRSGHVRLSSTLFPRGDPYCCSICAPSCGELTYDSVPRRQGRQLLPCSAVPCEPPRQYCSCSATGCRRKAAVNR